MKTSRPEEDELWPDEDDEDDLDDTFDDDDDIVARVEAAFREERARIRAATNQGALYSLRETYKEHPAAAPA